MRMILVLLFTSFSFGQRNVVASGHSGYTVGETFPILQQVDTVIQVNLAVPRFELPTEPKKEILKKKSFIEKLMEFFRKLIN